MMIKLTATLLMLLIACPLNAQADSAKVIQETRYQGEKYVTKTLALINMDEVYDMPLSNCTQVIDAIKVGGVQFSRSGITVESFWFTNDGERMVVPTNIGESKVLSNTDKAQASAFIKIGKRYLAHIQVCGSGGYPSLISLYAL